MNKEIIKAINFAKEKHKGQRDEVNKDVFKTHLKVVGETLQNLTNDIDIICAGYLHDTLEDTKTTYNELRVYFGKKVADLVSECTDEGEKDSYGKYFPRLKTKDAILIKFIDRASNLQRMENWSEKRKDQYLRRSKFWKDGSDIIKRDI